ncbi:GAF and ANTAR domain-containing protein [Citricoccus alkalitolerans]|uniref:GAF and ANTAR domain-containing protein n=1 Tax=Citricoccus alkalitolerans TaxID=246603 RepID=A0ABV8Y2M4_9MICC
MSDDEAQGKDDEKGATLGGPRDDELARHMSELARSLHAEEGEAAVLERMVGAAVGMIPGAQEASITLVHGRKRVETRVPTGDLAREIAALQEEVGQGPCLDAAFEHKTVSVPDLAAERRWPDFTAGALGLGAKSMLVFQLFIEGDNLGALNLYSRESDAFDCEAEQIGLLVAAHVAVAFAGTQKVEQLRDAAQSRDVIGQAKGILMERYNVTAEQAFLLLSGVSSHSNTKLVHVADHLASTGNLPSADGEPIPH